MDEDDVRDTEAATYMADEAIEVGLADRVGIFDEELEAWTASLETENETAITGEDEMSKFTQEQMDAAVEAARTEEKAKLSAAQTEALATANTAVKARITGIMSCEEAQKRPIAARNVAMDTELSVEAAKTFLAKMPEESAPAANSNPQNNGNAEAFKQAMSTGNPDVGAGREDDSSQAGAEKENPLLSAYRAAGGIKPKAA